MGTKLVREDIYRNQMPLNWPEVRLEGLVIMHW